jgi:putative transcriptional regulator
MDLKERSVALGRIGQDILTLVYTWRVDEAGEPIRSDPIRADPSRSDGLFPRGWPVEKKGERMPRFSLDDAMRAEPDDRSKMNETTEEDIQRQIASDPDTAPDLADEDHSDFAVRRTYPDLKKLRRRLALSQTEFAQAYGLSVWTLRQWEQGVVEPDGAARSYLKVIDQDPEGARRALARAS